MRELDISECSNLSIYRIMEYAELDYQVQCLALRRMPQESHLVPETIVQTFPELSQAWCCDNFHGEPFPVPNHPLGDEPFLDMQPKPL